MDCNNLLIEILKSGLWGSMPDLDMLANVTDEAWPKILAASLRQSVIALTADGVTMLPQRLLPPADILMQWIAYSSLIEDANKKMGEQTAGIFDTLNNFGLYPVLIKGQGIGDNYLNPEHRQCGDIDLYFGSKDLCKAAYKVLTGKDSQKFEDDGSIILNIKGQVIEAHSKAWDMISSDQEKILEQLKGLPRDFATINGKAIPIPNPTGHIMLLNLHIIRHASTFGIGLKQICDMAATLAKKHEMIDFRIIRDISEKLGLLKWNSALNSLMGRLGLPHEFWLPDSGKIVSPNHLTDVIFRCGNFGFQNNRYRHIWAPINFATISRYFPISNSFNTVTSLIKRKI